MRKIFYTLFWVVMLTSPAHAVSLHVACAANFTAAMKELADKYSMICGHEIRCTFGSTGMLYGQIINGAPYDVFFAADARRPALLHADGHAEKPTLYAKGKVVVWSKSKPLAAMPNWKEVVLSSSCDRVGIATPATAPYGQMAINAMDKAAVYAAVEPKLAYGKSVGTAFQYAFSGAADAAFVALSQAISSKGAGGYFWDIPEAAPIRQTACILKRGNTKEATQFIVWMRTPAAQEIMEKYGYE